MPLKTYGFYLGSERAINYESSLSPWGDWCREFYYLAITAFPCPGVGSGLMVKTLFSGLRSVHPQRQSWKTTHYSFGIFISSPHNSSFPLCVKSRTLYFSPFNRYGNWGDHTSSCMRAAELVGCRLATQWLRASLFSVVSFPGYVKLRSTAKWIHKHLISTPVCVPHCSEFYSNLCSVPRITVQHQS